METNLFVGLAGIPVGDMLQKPIDGREVPLFLLQILSSQL